MPKVYLNQVLFDEDENFLTFASSDNDFKPEDPNPEYDGEFEYSGAMEFTFEGGDRYVEQWYKRSPKETSEELAPIDT